MRKQVIALGLVAMAVLIASSASALSSINLVWKKSGTDTISPAPSATATVLIVLQGDSPEGVSGVFVSILFDTAELDFVSALEHSGPAARDSLGNQFEPIGAGVSVDESAGTILRFDSTSGLAPGCIACTVTLGSVVFHVTASTDNDGPNDVRIAIFQPAVDAIVSAVGGSSAGALTTASFGNAEVLPEPTTGLLIVGGLLGIG